jgi:AcrR family transcriptional regulator
MNANRNVERGQATRAHIIDVAMRLFAAHGYDGTSVEAVLADSGVSRGSLYHHFAGKDVLFLAVMEAVGAQMTEQATLALKDARDPLDGLRIGFVQYLRQAIDPVVRQIMLIDAPAVLGWQRWRAMDEQSTLGVIRNSIAYAADSGAVDQRHVDVFAHIILAAANEMAMMIALASDPSAALDDAESALAAFLDRLLGASRSPGSAGGVTNVSGPG